MNSRAPVGEAIALLMREPALVAKLRLNARATVDKWPTWADQRPAILETLDG